MSEQWLKVAEFEQIGEDDTLAVEHEGQHICLYRVGGQIFATDNRCSHGDAYLSDGLIVDGQQIECPLHEGRFDIRTGEPTGAPCTEPIRCHLVKVEANVVFLRSRATEGVVQ